jgi:hypothetical protein
MIVNRVWSMPNSRTFKIKPIRELLQRVCIGGKWADPYANACTITAVCPSLSVVTNDLSTEFSTDFHLDALAFLQTFADSSLDGVLYDPPYSTRQISECYKSVGKACTIGDTQSSFWSKQKDEIARIVKPGGVVLCFGWNSMGIGMSRGFTLSEILMIPHGGPHNDTLVTVETKDGVSAPKPKPIVKSNTLFKPTTRCKT